MITPDNISAEVLEAMRSWIADCSWPDLDDAADLTPAEVIGGVRRHFDGGINAFLQTMEVAA